MQPFYIKRGNTKPSLYATLTQQGGVVVDLTGATVKFHLGDVVDADAVIVDASVGSVRYDWGVADTAVAGSYRAEFEVTFPDGSTETFPNDTSIGVIIRGDVA